MACTQGFRRGDRARSQVLHFISIAPGAACPWVPATLRPRCGDRFVFASGETSTRPDARKLPVVHRQLMPDDCLGLSNTCPQVCATRPTEALRGQVSNKPKQLRPRQAAGLQVQAPRVLPIMRRAEDVADDSAPGGPCHPTRAGAPVGAVAADSAARAAGRAARADHAGAAGGAAPGHAASAGHCRAQRCRRPRWICHADPALRLLGQPEHSPAPPGPGRRVPQRRRRRAQHRRSECAHRRRAARAAADRHRPAHEDAHSPGCAGRGHGAELAR